MPGDLLLVEPLHDTLLALPCSRVVDETRGKRGEGFIGEGVGGVGLGGRGRLEKMFEEVVTEFSVVFHNLYN